MKPREILTNVGPHARARAHTNEYGFIRKLPYE